MISEFPLLAFTTLAGIAAGAYITNAFFADAQREEKRLWLFPLVCLVLLAVGLLGVTFHVGRPLRLLNAFSNPSSMLTEEAYWSILFGISVFIDLITAAVKKRRYKAVQIVAAIIGAVFVVIMSLAYFTAYAVDAWAAWPTLLLYIVGDAAMGAALFALFYRTLRKSSLLKALIALSALFALTAAVEALQFAFVGESFMGFIAASLIAAVAAGIAIWQRKADGSAKFQKAAVAICALMLASVVIARCTFYMASIL